MCEQSVTLPFQISDYKVRDIIDAFFKQHEKTQDFILSFVRSIAKDDENEVNCSATIILSG